MKVKEYLQRCATIDEKSLRKKDTSFSQIGQTIIGKKIENMNKSHLSNIDYPSILLPYAYDLKLSPRGRGFNSHRMDKETEAKNSRKNKDKSMTIQFKNTINNNITIINNIIQQTQEDNKMLQSSLFNKKDAGLKGVLKQEAKNSDNKPKPRKSVRFQNSLSPFNFFNDEKDELVHKSSKVSNKTEIDQDNNNTEEKEKNKSDNIVGNNNQKIDNNDGNNKSFDEIITPKVNKSKEKDRERYEREIDRIPKCHYSKVVGAFKGFSALTYHNQNKIHYDKLTILINKNLSKATDYNNENNIYNDYDNENKLINFFGIYHGINGEFTSSLLKKDIHNYIFNDKKVLTNPEAAIKKAHKAIEAHCYNSHSEATINDGSCSLILCEINNIIYTSNIGNSGCIISMNYASDVFNLCYSHTPLNQVEAKRIQSLPSCQIKTDSNGKNARLYPSGINVTRAIGFLSAKDNSKHKDINAIDNGVIAKPEIIVIDPNDDMDFIIMASEGIVNYLSNRDIIKLAYEAIKESLYSSDSYETMLDKILMTITKEAVKRNSKGNISIILLSMSNLEQIYKEKLILKVNEIINKIKSSKEDYTSMYPQLFKSPTFNKRKLGRQKSKKNSSNSNNSNSNNSKNRSNDQSPKNIIQSLKVKSKEKINEINNMININNEETKINHYKNSLECIDIINTNQSEKNKTKRRKKKKWYQCFCFK